MLLRGFAVATAEYAAAVDLVAAAAPFRQLQTPGGRTMSAAMTNCGSLGWYSDVKGYRYERCDPLSGLAWPAMPSIFLDLAQRAAAKAGYRNFLPDACLINRYAGKAKMGAHRDADERDFSQPIVSVSLGLPITFNFGGGSRTDPINRVKLQHGDVVVFGGESRLAFHGVGTLRRGQHEMTGNYRFNLTLRQSL